MGLLARLFTTAVLVACGMEEEVAEAIGKGAGVLVTLATCDACSLAVDCASTATELTIAICDCAADTGASA